MKNAYLKDYNPLKDSVSSKNSELFRARGFTRFPDYLKTA